MFSEAALDVTERFPLGDIEDGADRQTALRNRKPPATAVVGVEAPREEMQHYFGCIILTLSLLCVFTRRRDGTTTRKVEVHHAPFKCTSRRKSDPVCRKKTR